MTFTIPKKQLGAVLANAAGIAATKASLLPLTHVHCTATLAGNLVITATDLELGYTTAVSNLQWDTPPLRDLGFLLPAKKLAECVKAIPTPDVRFAIKLDNQRVTVSGGTVTYTLAGLDPLDFPALPEVSGQQFDLDAAALVRIIKAVAYAQSDDITKYNLCGINLKVEPNLDDELFLTAAATDGHRLALDTVPLPGDPRDVPADLAKGVIIPIKGVTVLSKISTSGVIVLSIAGNNLMVATPDEKIYTRLVDGTYPDYDRVIPKQFGGHVEVKRQALLDALERCRILSDGKSRGTRLGFGEDGIAIASELIETGNAADQVTASVNIDPFDLRVNADYLIQALDTMDCGIVNLQLTDSLAPLMVTPMGTDFPQALVMPQRL